jgi:predicted amidophosphoribosyltransferase
MQKLKQWFYSPCCLKCGSFFNEESLFCKPCFQQEILNAIENKTESHFTADQHIYLLDWPQCESKVLSEMIYRMKSDKSAAAWAFYAAMVYDVLKLQVNLARFTMLVPVPSAKQTSVHAKIFAEELGRLTGLPVCDLLSKKSFAGEQKKKSAADRKTSQSIELKRPHTEHFTSALFVDDLLTTGQSFLQSQKALKADNGSAIVTLFYRPKADGLCLLF